jgi:hypothetical protein
MKLRKTSLSSFVEEIVTLTTCTMFFSIGFQNGIMEAKIPRDMDPLTW